MHLRDRFEALTAFLLALGDDVQMKGLKSYFAFKRLRNFACVVVHPVYPEGGAVVVCANVDPDTVELVDGFTRDVRQVGHWGTGDLGVTMRTDEDLERAKPLLVKSYEAS